MPRLRILLVAVPAVLAAAAILWIAFRPEAHPAPPLRVRFVDVTDSSGIHFRHFNGATGRKLLPETMGSGVAVIDFDQDGRPDLFFVNSRAWPGHSLPTRERPTQALYRNRGEGLFEDVTRQVGLDVELFGMGVAVADFDNDRWPDIYITAVGGNRLYRNRGGQEFVDVTSAASVGGPSAWPDTSAESFLRITESISFPSSAGWLDYDGDGRLDLFVCYYLDWSPAGDLAVQAVLPGGIRAYVPPTEFRATQCRLYRNIDGTRFEDVTDSSGVKVVENGAPVGKSLGVAICDPDSDGWPDVVVACDMTRNLFFHNVEGTGGRRFEEMGHAVNLAYSEARPRGGMGIDTAEVLQGSLAVAIVNFSNEPNSLFQLRSPRPIRFIDTAVSTGLAGMTRLPMKFGALFFDADLDGRPDLFTANGHLEPDIEKAQGGHTYAQSAQLFWNTGESTRLWAAATRAEMGEDLFRPLVGRGCASLDFDGDGDLDLVVTENGGRARLFRNDNATSNNWIALSLTGNGTGSNRDAIGAEIELVAGGQSQRRTITTARGYLSQSDLTATFGLGPTTVVEKVTVRWPGRTGAIRTWENLAAGKRHFLAQ